jgi:hypothetical protein
MKRKLIVEWPKGLAGRYRAVQVIHPNETVKDYYVERRSEDALGGECWTTVASTRGSSGGVRSIATDFVLLLRQLAEEKES